MSFCLQVYWLFHLYHMVLVIVFFWAGFNFVSSCAIRMGRKCVHCSSWPPIRTYLETFWCKPLLSPSYVCILNGATKQVSLSFLTVWFGWLHFTGHETISLGLLSFFINARWFNRWWLPALINRGFFPDGQSYKSYCCVPKVLSFSCPEFAGGDFSHVAG